MIKPAVPDQERTPKNLNKGKSKNTKVKNGVVLDKKEDRPIAPPKQAPDKTPYSYRASLGTMPTDPMQKAINDKPPVEDPDMLRKNWSKADHIKNAKAIDKHRAELQTKEQRNLKQVIGTQEGNSPAPGLIKNNSNRE